MVKKKVKKKKISKKSNVPKKPKKKVIKHIKKKKSKINKKDLNKSEENLLFLLLAVLTVSLVIFFYLGNEKAEPVQIFQDYGVQEDNIQNNILSELKVKIITDGNNSLIIKNEFEQYADCLIFNSNNNFVRQVGIIKPNSQKIISNLRYSSQFKLDCQYKNNWDFSLNVSDCEHSTFELCSVAAQNEQLIQCMDEFNDIPYQYFCVALISENISYCEFINEFPRKIHCLAYNQKNPDLCNKLNGTFRDWCYQDLAINWNSENLCDEIQN